jgi:hypothetical protein
MLKSCTATATLVLLYAPAAIAGPAIGQFETKDLESKPGEIQFQSQNAFSFGQPGRRVNADEPGEARFDDNTIARERYALELQKGITTWLRARVGIEFEKERFDDPASIAQANAFGELKLSSISLEGVFILVSPGKSGFGLGLLTEYEHGVGPEADLFSAGPIIGLSSGPWSALANLLIVQHLDTPDRKRDFAYAAQIQYEASSSWALALEAYGTVDRIGRSGSRPVEQMGFPDFDQHRLGPVVYYRFGSQASPDATKSLVKPPGRHKTVKADDDGDDHEEPVSLGVGMLFGLNGNTPDKTLKLSLEVDF